MVPFWCFSVRSVKIAALPTGSEPGIPHTAVSTFCMYSTTLYQILSLHSESQLGYSDYKWQYGERGFKNLFLWYHFGVFL